MIPAAQLCESVDLPAGDRRSCRPLIWGCRATDLHDAYWRAHGVQCVHRGISTPLQRQADFYLLVEPDQLVLFDLPALADHIAWRRATVTRVRVLDVDGEPYREHVDLDEHGLVRCVTRHYHPRSKAAYRVLLSRRRRIAQIWMTSVTRRDAWMDIRHSSGLSQIDNVRQEGGCFVSGQPAEEVRMLNRLVTMWRQPGHAILGIQEIRNGVWAASGAVLADRRRCLGPLWLGLGALDNGQVCLVGPACHPDVPTAPQPPPSQIQLLDIREIEPASRRTEHPRPAAGHRSGYALAKRLFDIGASSIGLVISAPVLCVVALLIALDDGCPVFYAHVRQTRGGRYFRCWKFRTMYRDADKTKQSLTRDNTCDGPQFFIKDDPRVTRIGRILRRYHLDEIPQLWNVLLGQMSMVGPRPSPDDENRICPAWRELRLSVRPGITGLWQLHCTRQSGIDFQEWVRFDTEYVERANFWLDMTILGQTLKKILLRG